MRGVDQVEVVGDETFVEAWPPCGSWFVDQDQGDRLVDVDAGAGDHLGRSVAVLAGNVQLVDGREQFGIGDGAEVVGAGHEQTSLLDEVVDERTIGLDGFDRGWSRSGS